MATIKNLLIRIGISDDRVASGVRGVNKSLDSIAARVDGLQKVGHVGLFAALAGSAIQLGRAFAPAITALGHFAVAAAPAAGAVLALPAAIAVAGAAVATLKVGVNGVGAAMKAAATGDAKALDTALKRLSPSARAFVVTMAQAKNSFDPVRRAVQEKLFAGLAAQMRVVTLNALPGLRVGMTDVATQMNGLARAGLSAARTPLFSGVLRQVLGTTAAVLESFKPAVRPLILGLARLVSIGLPLVEVFGQWAGRMATAGARLLASDRAANKFSQTIDRAIGVFRRNGNAANAWAKAMAQIHIVWGQLSAVGQNVWSVVTAVGRAMGNSAQPSRSLLQLITDLTKRMADWANSAEGQKQLTQLFTSLQQVAANLVEILPQLGGVLTLILSLINAMPAPVRNTMLQFLAWSIVLSRFTGPIGGAVKLLGALGNSASAVNRFGATSGRAMGAIGRGVGTAGAAVGRATGSAIAALTRLAAASAITVARVVADWVVMGVQSLIQAAKMAAAWIIGLGPIAWITAAVIAVVALVIANWGTVKRATVAVWDAVWSFVSGIVSRVVNFVRDHWRVLITLLGGPLGLAVALISKYWQQIWSIISAIPDAIGRVFSNAGRWLYNAGRSIIFGLWDGVLSVWNWLVRQFDRLTSLIPSWKGPPARDRRLLQPSGAAIMRGLSAGITSQLPALRRTLAGVTDEVGSGIAMPVTAAGVTASATSKRPGAGRANGGAAVRVWFDWSSGNGELKKVIQKIVRVDGGGNVQAALGGNS